MDWKVGDRFEDTTWPGEGRATGEVVAVTDDGLVLRWDHDDRVFGRAPDDAFLTRIKKIESEASELVNADDLPSMTLKDLRAIADKLNPPVTQPVADPLRDLIEEAYAIVNGSRQADYGPPEDNFARIAKRWSTHAGVTVCAEDAALMMIDLKLARLKATPDHRDSVVDLIGYALCYWRIVSKS